MPLTLPTDDQPSTTTANNPLHTITANIKSRIFRPLDLSNTRGQIIAATVLLRALANIAHFVLTGLSRRPLVCLYYVIDQLVVMYALSFIVDAAASGAGRRVGGLRIPGRFFELFLGGSAVVHVLYVGILLVCIVTFAIFFGVTAEFVVTIAGWLIVVVSWLTFLPEEDEGGLTLP
ncbi:hypothetical protein B0J18DRAFT_456453 [Chaetomium sp. MPI-SDFR-AT-0129]|nr:hypothetical protein B0J18DRAFT_456453 [Chaetomium sp. MPI-SDFR-AT-0129]